MDYTYDPALVALSIATAMLGVFTALVVTVDISRVHPSEIALRILLAAVSVGSGIWATHFVSLTAMSLPAAPEFNLSLVAYSMAIMMILGGGAFAIVAIRRFGWIGFVLASLLLTAALASMHVLGFHALANYYALELSLLGGVMTLVIALQTSAAILWVAFKQRALFGTFLAAIALGLAISATNYSALEAVTLRLPDGAPAYQQIDGPDYSLALSAAGVIYSICGFCIGIFALVGSIKRAGPGGPQGVAG